MLVLSRRVGEEIVINGNIRITVVMMKGNQVRLGITAPSSVPVYRQELLVCEDGMIGAKPGSPPVLATS